MKGNSIIMRMIFLLVNIVSIFFCRKRYENNSVAISNILLEFVSMKTTARISSINTLYELLIFISFKYRKSIIASETCMASMFGLLKPSAYRDILSLEKEKSVVACSVNKRINVIRLKIFKMRSIVIIFLKDIVLQLTITMSRRMGVKKPV